MFAYVLLEVNPGAERDILDDIGKMDEVKDINMLFGEWDIIAKVELEGPEALERFVVEKIRTLSEVRMTSTMIAAK